MTSATLLFRERIDMKVSERRVCTFSEKVIASARVIRCEISREINVMGKTVDGSSVSSIQYSDSECARKRLHGSNAVTNGHGIVRESWSFSFQYSASLS